MAKDTAKKTKRPTAEKRMIQNEKKRLKNKMFKSRVKTCLRSFEASLKGTESVDIAKKLSEVYALMDKGVKRGIFKLNQARRTKSKLAIRSKAA